ncbi:MAG: prepilin-type N-terminal cleavage/methylation domain-containing protein [Planctomycetota bacterium]
MNRRARHTRGFTLLEVLLATAVLASVVALVSTMFVQAHAMADDAVAGSGATRAQRVVQALRTQWATRRSAMVGMSDADAVIVKPNAISFLTSTPLLYPGWPIVEASYTVELDDVTGFAGESRYRLVYEERPVSSIQTEAARWGETDDREDAESRRSFESFTPGDERVRAMTMLRASRSLRFERFGRPVVQEAFNGNVIGGVPADSIESFEAAVAERQADEQTTDGEAISRIEAWRPIPPIADESQNDRAFRLVGSHEGEAFSCVLNGAASR